MNNGTANRLKKDVHSPDGILHDIAGRGPSVQSGSAGGTMTKEVKALVTSAKTPGWRRDT